MMRESIGAVEYRDQQYETRAQIVITRLPERKITNLFLDLDVGGKGVIGAGDCEIGLDRENAVRLLSLLQKATCTPPKEPLSWQCVGHTEFCWSDKSGPGRDSGLVLVESNGEAGRMTIQTRTNDWWPYTATFSLTLVDEVSVLLKRALGEP
jgi:hypothetical protein